MAGGTKRLPRAVREQQMLDAAVQVFSINGYHETSMDAIAAQAAAALGPAPMADTPMPVLGAPLGSQGLNVLGQRPAANTDPAAPAPEAGPLGLPLGTPGLTADTVLGQNAVPSRPGAGGRCIW